MKYFVKFRSWYVVWLSIISITTILYVANAGFSVPIMDYWRYIEEIGWKWGQGNLQFVDLWMLQTPMSRNPLTHLIMLADLQFFGFNVKIQAVTGALVLIGVAWLLVWQAKKHAQLDGWTIAAIGMACLNFNQWEILTEPFALSFFLRILTYYALFVWCDSLLIKAPSHGYTSDTIIFGCCVAFFVCFLSQMYFPFLIAALLVSYAIVIWDKRNAVYVKSFGIVSCCCILACIVYLHGFSSPNSLSGQTIMEQLFSGALIKGSLLIVGSSLLQFFNGSSFHEGMVAIMGLLIICWIVLMGVFYFKEKLYRKTMFPLMCIVYAATATVGITVARISDFSASYLMSSRYVVETTIGLVGLLWMTGLVAENRPKKIQIGFKIIPIVIIVCLSMAMISELRIMPSRKAYGDNLKTMMQNIEAYKDEELVPFQANTPELVRDGVRFLEQYQLNVFGDDASRDSIKSIGVYEDGWVAPNASISIRSGEENVAVLKGYYPGEITGDQIINIYIDDMMVTSFIISSPEFEIPFEIESNSNTEVHLEANFTVPAVAPDIRELSFVLVDTHSR